MRFFFFGSLMDADVRAIVLGRPLPDRRCRRARIDGYRRVRAVGKSYPMLLPAPGRSVVGLVVHGLNRTDAARLRYFEGTAYRLARRTVTWDNGAICPAHLFLSATGLHPLRRDWDYVAWQQRAKRRFIASAKRRMAAWRKRFASA